MPKTVPFTPVISNPNIGQSKTAPNTDSNTALNTDSGTTARCRFTPAPQKRLRLNDRDLRVLAFLQDNVLASRSQLQELFYGSRAYCNSRLRDLFDHALVRRFFPAVTRGGCFGEEAVYAVGSAAVPLLVEHLEEPFETVKALVRRREAPLFVEHTLRTVDIYLSLRRAAPTAGLAIERWIGETSARHDYDVADPAGHWKRESFKPDGFLRVQDTQGVYHSLFIECDRGHASQAQWQIKVAAYRRYLDSGLFASTYGETSFLALAVTTGEYRLGHLRATTQHAGGPFFRFTTFAALQQHGAFGPIWTAPDGSRPEPLF